MPSTAPATLPRNAVPALVPGLTAAAAVAGAALLLHRLPGLGLFSPMILAIALGMALRNGVGVPAAWRPGLAVAMRPLLRAAIVLLGLQLTLHQVAEVGAAGMAVIAASLLATLWFTGWLGRRLGVEAGLARLIGAGTAICGASAVIAANTVTRASDEDVAYAMACVTLFGTLAMLSYPALAGVLGLGPAAYGIWAGASIHEVAQVVAAAFQNGPAAGELGTVAKLSRVMLLAPVVLAFALAARRGNGAGGSGNGQAARVPVPWFVLGFVAMIAVNSLDLLPAAAHPPAALASQAALTVALAAMGLETDIRALRARGWRPMLLGAGTWLFIALFSLGAVRLIA